MENKTPKIRVRPSGSDLIRYIVPFFSLAAAHALAAMTLKDLDEEIRFLSYAIMLFVWAGLSYGMYLSFERGALNLVLILCPLFAIASGVLCMGESESSFLPIEAVMSAAIIAGASSCAITGGMELSIRDLVLCAALFGLSLAVLMLGDGLFSACCALAAVISIVLLKATPKEVSTRP